MKVYTHTFMNMKGSVIPRKAFEPKIDFHTGMYSYMYIHIGTICGDYVHANTQTKVSKQMH